MRPVDAGPPIATVNPATGELLRVLRALRRRRRRGQRLAAAAAAVPLLGPDAPSRSGPGC